MQNKTASHGTTQTAGFIIKSVYALASHETARWIEEARRNPAQLVAFSAIFKSKRAAIEAMKVAGLWNVKVPTCQIVDLSIFPKAQLLIA